MKWLPCRPGDPDCYLLLDDRAQRVMEVSRREPTWLHWTIWDWTDPSRPRNAGLIGTEEVYAAIRDPEAFYMEHIL